MSWSEKRKEYFIKLFPDYRLGFLLMNISKGVDLRHHNMSDYDSQTGFDSILTLI